MGNAPKPRIGITAGIREEGWGPDGTKWLAYAEAVELAGGHAVHLDRATLGRERQVLSELDGLLLSGGNDVHLDQYPNPPELNGESPEAVMDRFRMFPEPERDEYELPLLREALDADLPLLGICRGCQVLNVGLGGRLVLDVALEVGEQIIHRTLPDAPQSRRHALQIHPDTQLASILPPEEFTTCNSRHHQAVRLDEAFTARVTAICPDDGVVEAIEVPGRRWTQGIQWHPEHRTDTGIRTTFQPLFVAFIQAAS
jgi:putative glutamine amidotransferase